MLKINDVYALPYKIIPLTDWILRADWFPELSHLSGLTDHATLQEMQDQKRLEVRQIHQVTHDHTRYNAMYALAFDGANVALLHNGGRDGDDSRDRWVTDRTGYAQVLAYLISMEPTPEIPGIQGYYDPEALHYEESLFHGIGSSAAAALGFPFEPKVEGYTLCPNRRAGLMSSESEDVVFLFAKKGAPEPSEYIRRGGCVMKRGRLIPREEIEMVNPRMNLVNDEHGEDRVYSYLECEKPDGEVLIVSV